MSSVQHAVECGCENNSWHVFNRCTPDDKATRTNMIIMAMCCQRLFEASIMNVDHATFLRHLMSVAFEVVKLSRKVTGGGEEPAAPSHSERYLTAFQAMCMSKYVQARVIPEKSLSYH